MTTYPIHKGLFFRSSSAAEKGVGNGLISTARHLWRSAAEAHRKRQTIRHLEKLDDRILNDIGISRSGLHASVMVEKNRR